MPAKGAKRPHASRNPSLKSGISKHSRSRSSQLSGKFLVKKKNGGKWPQHAAKPKAAAGSGKKAPRWYPAENVGRDRERSKFRTWDAVKGRWIYKHHQAKLRSTITPGTVLILLAGKHRGKRVVFLNQLHSGLLLVTGPFKLSGVPLRRVNQAYVIATKTKVAIPAIDLKKFDDNYFRKKFKKEKNAGKKREKKDKAVFAEGDKKKKTSPKALPEEKKADQKTVDGPILKAIKATPFLGAYLRSDFALHKGQYPHRLVF